VAIHADVALGPLRPRLALNSRFTSNAGGTGLAGRASQALLPSWPNGAWVARRPDAAGRARITSLAGGSGDTLRPRRPRFTALPVGALLPRGPLLALLALLTLAAPLAEPTAIGADDRVTGEDELPIRVDRDV
jgi:hypothetical protein